MTAIISNVLIKQSDSLSKMDLSILMGNALDHFDVALYGFLAPVLAQLFFPGDDHVVSLIKAYSVLATSLYTRPIGSYFFGVMAQRFGGAFALSYSLIGVAATTILIGLIPTHASIGWCSPVMLIIIRMIQGIFAEGEHSIAKLYILENKYSAQAFKASYSYQMSTMLGIVLASAVSTAIIHFSYVEYWRLCFIFGGNIGIVGYYLRRYNTCIASGGGRSTVQNVIPAKYCCVDLQNDDIIEDYKQSLGCHTRESGYPGKYSGYGSTKCITVFKRNNSAAQVRHGSVSFQSNISLLLKNKLNILRVCLVNAVYQVTYIIPFVVMNSLLPMISHISLSEMMASNTTLSIIDMLLIPVVGRMVQNYDYKKVMLTSLYVLSASIIPLWINLQEASLLYVNFIRLWIIIWGVVFICPLNIWVNNLFSNSDKYILTGVGSAFGSAIFGRLTPSLCLLLWHLTNSLLPIGIFIVIILLLTIWAVGMNSSVQNC